MRLLGRIGRAMTIGVYRLSRGRIGGSMPWMGGDMSILLLTTTGRRSGKPRTAVLGSFVDGGRYVVVASNAGKPDDPSWLINIRAQPRVTVQVRERVFEATAAIAEPTERTRLWAELLEHGPAYARYEKRTREVPLVVLTPDPG
jgi:deazaflavin-dependent oxidoreductase (nitroreductase family)